MRSSARLALHGHPLAPIVVAHIATCRGRPLLGLCGRPLLGADRRPSHSGCGLPRSGVVALRCGQPPTPIFWTLTVAHYWAHTVAHDATHSPLHQRPVLPIMGHPALATRGTLWTPTPFHPRPLLGHHRWPRDSPRGLPASPILDLHACPFWTPNPEHWATILRYVVAHTTSRSGQAVVGGRPRLSSPAHYLPTSCPPMSTMCPPPPILRPLLPTTCPATPTICPPSSTTRPVLPILRTLDGHALGFGRPLCAHYPSSLVHELSTLAQSCGQSLAFWTTTSAGWRHVAIQGEACFGRPIRTMGDQSCVLWTATRLGFNVARRFVGWGGDVLLCYHPCPRGGCEALTGDHEALWARFFLRPSRLWTPSLAFCVATRLVTDGQSMAKCPSLVAHHAILGIHDEAFADGQSCFIGAPHRCVVTQLALLGAHTYRESDNTTTRRVVRQSVVGGF